MQSRRQNEDYRPVQFRREVPVEKIYIDTLLKRKDHNEINLYKRQYLEPKVEDTPVEKLFIVIKICAWSDTEGSKCKKVETLIIPDKSLANGWLCSEHKAPSRESLIEPVLNAPLDETKLANNNFNELFATIAKNREDYIVQRCRHLNNQVTECLNLNIIPVKEYINIFTFFPPQPWFCSQHINRIVYSVPDLTNVENTSREAHLEVESYNSQANHSSTFSDVANDLNTNTNENVSISSLDGNSTTLNEVDRNEKSEPPKSSIVETTNRKLLLETQVNLEDQEASMDMIGNRNLTVEDTFQAPYDETIFEPIKKATKTKLKKILDNISTAPEASRHIFLYFSNRRISAKTHVQHFKVGTVMQYEEDGMANQFKCPIIKNFSKPLKNSFVNPVTKVLQLECTRPTLALNLIHTELVSCYSPVQNKKDEYCEGCSGYHREWYSTPLKFSKPTLAPDGFTASTESEGILFVRQVVIRWVGFVNTIKNGAMEPVEVGSSSRSSSPISSVGSESSFGSEELLVLNVDEGANSSPTPTHTLSTPISSKSGEPSETGSQSALFNPAFPIGYDEQTLFARLTSQTKRKLVTILNSAHMNYDIAPGYFYVTASIPSGPMVGFRPGPSGKDNLIQYFKIGGPLDIEDLKSSRWKKCPAVKSFPTVTSHLNKEQLAPFAKVVLKKFSTNVQLLTDLVSIELANSFVNVAAHNQKKCKGCNSASTDWFTTDVHAVYEIYGQQAISALDAQYPGLTLVKRVVAKWDQVLENHYNPTSQLNEVSLAQMVENEGPCQVALTASDRERIIGSALTAFKSNLQAKLKSILSEDNDKDELLPIFLYHAKPIIDNNGNLPSHTYFKVGIEMSETKKTNKQLRKCGLILQGIKKGEIKSCELVAIKSYSTHQPQKFLKLLSTTLARFRANFKVEGTCQGCGSTTNHSDWFIMEKNSSHTFLIEISNPTQIIKLNSNTFQKLMLHVADLWNTSLNQLYPK